MSEQKAIESELPRWYSFWQDNMRLPFYHVSSFEDFPNIQKNGLKSSADGYIYGFYEKKAAADIAIGQLFLRDYALFLISCVDDLSKVTFDYVGENTAPYHVRIRQDIITPKNLSFLGMYKVIIPKLTQTDGQSKQPQKTLKKKLNI